MSVEIKIPKKLIEVALPLDAINAACAHEKQPGIGAHPRGLHLWWARRPLPASRAVLFSQLVNDPGFQQGEGFKFGLNKDRAAEERKRLFKIIEELVKWENLNNESIINQARNEIEKSWRETCELNKNHPQANELFNPEKMPGFHDPFAGGGAIPLEAQRLGLESFASDLNPVAVVINKAMIEIPPRFTNRPPVGSPRPDDRQNNFMHNWQGIDGLATDIQRYGYKIWDEACKRIGTIYPQIEITKSTTLDRPDLKIYEGKKLNVIGWIWARTVKSPNPAFSHLEVPLVSNFILSSKAGKTAYVEPVISKNGYEFHVRTGEIPKGAELGTTAGKRAAFICLFSKAPIDYDYIRTQGKDGKMGQRMMAIIAEGTRGKVYISPTDAHILAANSVAPSWKSSIPLPFNPRDFKTPNYGLTTFGDLFTPRQLVTLNTLCDLVSGILPVIEKDAIEAGFANDGVPLDKGGTGAQAYAEAVGVYLAFAIDRLTDYGSSIATWKSSGEQVMQTYKRQAIPMTWDFPESNLLGEKAICWLNAVEYASENLISTYPVGVKAIQGSAVQADAQTQIISKDKIISTDPPYYDNIGYADLSDYFYIWLKRSLGSIFPDLFKDATVPKDQELVATPYRHGGKEQAESFFLNGMKKAIYRLAEISHPAYPVTIYYAFKQSETEAETGTSNTGWDTFLKAVVDAGFAITGTWPMRTELSNRMIASGTNALASSVVLVCRRRPKTAVSISRRDFIRELNNTLPDALAEMMSGSEHSPIAPVDLSQAIIGPGMAIFSKYSSVLEANGQPMTVKTALQLINRYISEDDFDLDTQFCMNWFETNGWAEGLFGQADVLARAKGTSVEGLRDGGVANSSAGKFSLIKWQDLDEDWSIETDNRTSHWEMLHHLIRAYNKNGESSAGEILSRIHSKSETIRALAYRLYTVCERKKYADDAANYNNLILAWEAIEMAAHSVGVKDTQISLFDNEPEAKENTKKTKRKK